MSGVYGSGFEVQVSGVRIPGFGIQVSRSGSRGSGLESWVDVSRFTILGFHASVRRGKGSRVWGAGLGLRLWGLRLAVQGAVFRGQNSGLRVEG